MSAQGTLSVTEVRNALRCPRVFALGRLAGPTVAFPIGASSLGALFHRIVEVFTRGVDDPPAALRSLRRDDRAAIEHALARWLLAPLVVELERDAKLATIASEVDDLAEALRALAAYLAGEIAKSEDAPADALGALLEHGELAVEMIVRPGEGQAVRLTGRVDAVHARASGAFDVVEYKLTDEANDELDRAQVALYRYLLRGSLDMHAAPVILRFNPALTVTRLDGRDADALVEERLLPLIARMVQWADAPETAPATTRRDLCPACPVRVRCAETYPSRLGPRDEPPAGASRPRPDAAGQLGKATASELARGSRQDPEGEAEAADLAKAITQALKRRGVQVTTRLVAGASLLRVEVASTARQRVAALDAAASDVEHQLAERDVRFEKQGARRAFVAPRKARRPVQLADLLAMRSDWLRARPGRFVVGEDTDGGVVSGDLADGSTCHLLVAGQTGSGKSVLLRGLVSSLVHFHPPSSIQITLVDPKRVTFHALVASIAAHMSGPMRHDVEEVLPRLEELAAEMEERYEKFAAADVQSIDDYNEVASETLPRHIVVVDEFQDLIVGRATKQAFLDGVRRLGAKARAAGIHLVLATQRPDRQTVPGEITANLVGRIALKVQGQVNSRIILDAGGAERLLGHGDLLASLGHGLVRAQAPLV